MNTTTRLIVLGSIGSVIWLWLRPAAVSTPVVVTTGSKDIDSTEKRSNTIPFRRMVRTPKLNPALLRQLAQTAAPSSPQADTATDTGEFWAPMRAFVFVQNPDGSIPERGMIISQKCQLYQPFGEDGFVELELTEDCDLIATRQDGLFLAFSNEEWIAFEAGADWEVELNLPEERTGGIGISIEKVEQGFAVTYVFPDGPGARIGLESGDVITEIDGNPADDLSLYDFIQTATGAEGTNASFRLLGDSEEDPVREYTRERLEG